jgi:hypothetical protein
MIAIVNFEDAEAIVDAKQSNLHSYSIPKIMINKALDAEAAFCGKFCFCARTGWPRISNKLCVS